MPNYDDVADFYLRLGAATADKPKTLTDVLIIDKLNDTETEESEQP